MRLRPHSSLATSSSIILDFDRLSPSEIRPSSLFTIFSLLSLNLSRATRLFASLEDRVRQFATPRYKNSHLRPVRMDRKRGGRRREKKKKGSNLSTLSLSNGETAPSTFFAEFGTALEQRSPTSASFDLLERRDNENLFRVERFYDECNAEAGRGGG